MFLAYVSRSLLARRGENVLTLLTIILFVMGGCVGLTMYLSMRHEIVRSSPAENVVVVAKGTETEGFGAIDLDHTRRIALLDGVRRDGDVPLAVREHLTYAMISSIDNPTRFEPPVAVRGIDGDLSIKVHRVTIIEGARPAPGSNSVLIGKKLLTRYPRLTIGSLIPLGPVDVSIAGIFRTGGGTLDGEILIDRAALQRELKLHDINTMTIVADSASRVPALTDSINSSREVQATAIPLTKLRSKQAGLERMLHIIALMLALFGVVAAIALSVTMNAAISSRLPELAALAAIGIRRRRLAGMVVLESSLLAMIGTALGLIAAELVRRGVGSLSVGMQSMTLDGSVLALVLGVVIGLFVGVVGALSPAWKVWRLSVVDTLR